MSPYIFHYDEPSVAEPGDELAIQMRIKKAVKERVRGGKWIAVPNGTQRTAWTAMNAKREGMSSGFPDGMVLAGGGFVAFVEVKARAGQLSDNQIEHLNWLTNAGFHAGCFRSVATLMAWLSEKGAVLA